MSPAHGRPPSKDPKIHDTKIKMSGNDIKMLKYCCEKTGEKKAEIIRMGIKKVYEDIKIRMTDILDGYSHSYRY